MREKSLTDLLTFLTELHAQRCDLYLNQQSLDTSAPAGRAMFQMMGVFAEFGRAMIQERVKAGLARAKAQGTRLGRPSVGADVEARIRELKANGVGILKIAKTLGIGVSAVQRVTKNAPAIWSRAITETA